MVRRRFILCCCRSLTSSTKPEQSVASQIHRFASNKSLAEGRRLHAYLLKHGHLDRDPALLNDVSQMYATCDSLVEARTVFDKIAAPESPSWNGLIAAYARNGQLQEAKRLYDSMPEKTPASTAAIVAAYAKSGHQHQAKSMFDTMPVKTAPAWNCIISMYAEKGRFHEAKALFDSMPNPNIVTSNVILTALGHYGRVDEAREVFDRMKDRSVVSWNSMITIYCQNARLCEAKQLFDRFSEKNTTSWNTMIAGYGQNGRAKDALHVFIVMDLEGEQPNRFTFCSVLDACASLSYAAEGMIVHDYIEQHGVQDVMVSNALANMYGKCGKLGKAKAVFDSLPQPNVVSWTGMVAAYAQNGFNSQALKFFRTMVQAGVEPNGITIINTLSACSHGGLFDEGEEVFTSLTGHDYVGVSPKADHFLCMIDLLGRAGNLDGAEGLLRRMPYEAGEVAWTSLLSACRTHRDMERAARVSRTILAMNRRNAEDPAPYVMLGNIYVAGCKKVKTWGGIKMGKTAGYQLDQDHRSQKQLTSR